MNIRTIILGAAIALGVMASSASAQHGYSRGHWGSRCAGPPVSHHSSYRHGGWGSYRWQAAPVRWSGYYSGGSYCAPVVYSPPAIYCPPPTYYPPPVVYYPAPGCYQTYAAPVYTVPTYYDCSPRYYGGGCGGWGNGGWGDYPGWHGWRGWVHGGSVWRQGVW